MVSHFCRDELLRGYFTPTAHRVLDEHSNHKWAGGLRVKIGTKLSRLHCGANSDAGSAPAWREWSSWHFVKSVKGSTGYLPIFGNVLAWKWWHLKLFQPKRSFNVSISLQAFLSIKNPTFEASWTPLSDPLCFSSYLSVSLRSCLRFAVKISFSRHNCSLHDGSDPFAANLGINSGWVHIKYLMEMHEALGHLSQSVSGQMNQARIRKIRVMKLHVVDIWSE